MKKTIAFFGSRVFLIVVLIMLQLSLLVFTIFSISQYSPIFYYINVLISLIMAVYVLNRKDNPAFKITWIIVIMIFPFLGGILYIMFGGKKMPKRLMNEYLIDEQKRKPLLNQDDHILEEIKGEDINVYHQFNYIWRNSAYPTYRDAFSHYYPLGDLAFNDILNDLKSAKKYIFLEYFIVDQGLFFNSMLDILKKKVEEGVEVRLMYDGFGCINILPSNYPSILRRYGIKVKVFNPLRPLLTVTMNNRDHRKILIIDGKVGYSGGVNLADEYINKKKRFGHWKDSVVRLEGNVVDSLLISFLQMYDTNLAGFEKYKAIHRKQNKQGYINFFADSPTDDEATGENVHMNMINGANNYLYISTPYLIISNEMSSCLCLAAKKGIDVRIMCPHIPDKWYVHEVTKKNYYKLLENGVKIYEYTPGFNHAKELICDDKLAFVGTINMDYRSYYLHFECGAIIYDNPIVLDMKEKYIKFLESCQEVSLKELNDRSFWEKVLANLLNLVAPFF
ncbi:MAG: cardiolipin synthase [Erysipelotrichaceae bacterium]